MTAPSLGSMADTTTEDFLDAPEPVAPAYADDAALPPRHRVPTWIATGGWLLVGLIVGALVVAMLHSNKAASATGLPGAPTANQAPGGQAPQQGFAGPPGGFGGGPRGGLPGEEHVVGTLSAVGASTITVKSASGTATYPIDATTLLVKDGQRVSSLAALTVGDTVVVHVYPSNGSTRVEMVLDGVPPGDDDNTGTTTET